MNRINLFLRQFPFSKIPFSVFFRWYVFLGIFLRIGPPYLRFKPTKSPLWLIPLVIYGLYALRITVRYLKNPENQKAQESFRLQLFMDVFFVSLYYFLTGNVDTELYLNYSLPILLLIEHGGKTKATLFYYSLICVTFFLTLTLMAIFMDIGSGYLHIMYRAFIPRVLFSFLVLCFAISRNRLIEAQASELSVLRKKAGLNADQENLQTRLEGETYPGGH